MQTPDTTMPDSKVVRLASARASKPPEAVYPVMEYIADLAEELATMAEFAEDETLAGLLNAAAQHARERLGG